MFKNLHVLHGAGGGKKVELQVPGEGGVQLVSHLLVGGDPQPRLQAQAQAVL
jgi:hypothetical protein